MSRGEAPDLTRSWRALTRLATGVMLLAWPSIFLYLKQVNDWAALKALIISFGIVVAARGLLDLYLRRTMLPWPSLFNTHEPRLRREDITRRRRYWFWRFWTRAGTAYLVLVSGLTLLRGGQFGDRLTSTLPDLLHTAGNPAILIQGAYVIGLFAANFLIFMGPLLLMGVSQIKTYEPGDASWGVKLEDVRGQDEAKEETRRIVEIWQSGEAFEAAGGKRERGLLFLGPPGVGKTFMAKAIATGFNAPFITIPGSGFAQTFIGIDAIIVRYLARKAKKVARKWGGQAIVFIDEIDAVGMRRGSLQGGGVMGPGGIFGGGGVGGGLALNQLLVTMDSIDSPPFTRMALTKKVNTLLDALYVMPARLRLPTPRPRKDQIYFIGATNVPLDVLDPALTRPGRMGRHVWFRTPTKRDRLDVFDLYLSKVAHDPDLDSEARRDEISRITSGVSPAAIEQICSMALLNAQHEGRVAFNFDDLTEAITTIESGTATKIAYTDAETRAVAIHEAGHAAAAHVYRHEVESSRLSIKMRGSSLGHHQSYEREERFSRWRSEDFAELVHALAAMAAEYVFYGENSRGVGGDLQMATQLARYMVEACGMSPLVDDKVHREETRRFERIGRRLLSRATGEQVADPVKLAQAAQLLGHAFTVAYVFVAFNRDAVERVAERVIKRKEIFGDELVRLLDQQKLVEVPVVGDEVLGASVPLSLL